MGGFYRKSMNFDDSVLICGTNQKYSNLEELYEKEKVNIK